MEFLKLEVYYSHWTVELCK